jgi:hypothetical protein
MLIVIPDHGKKKYRRSHATHVVFVRSDLQRATSLIESRAPRTRLRSHATVERPRFAPMS